MTANSRAIRPFLIALLVFLGLPPLLFLCLLHLGDAHGGLLFLFLSPLAGAYPFSAATSFPRWLAFSLTAIQMIALAWVFARFTRDFRASHQLFMAIVALGLLGLLGTVVYGLLGIDTRGDSFPWP